jgi:DNA-directed RNA polymerase specialized sigma24 family protein
VRGVVYRKRVEWPPHVRQALFEEVRRGVEDARAARAAFKRSVYRAVEMGVTTREIAKTLGISQAAVSRYRIEGEAEYRACLVTAE